MVEQEGRITPITQPIVTVDAYRVRPRRIGRWPWTWRTTLRKLLVAAAFFGVVWILYRSRAALTPFIIGLVLAYLLSPIVNRLSRRMPRWAAILVVYSVGLVVIVGAFALIVPPAVTQVNEVIQGAPGYYRAAEGRVNELINEFNSQAPPEVQEQARTQIARVQETIQVNASRYAQSVGEFVFNSVLGIFQTLTFLLGFLIIPFFLFYVLSDANKIPDFVNSLLHPRIRADFWNLLRITDSIFGKFIRGQLILGAIIGVCSFVGLQALNLFGFNVRFTVLLAIVAAIGELVPMIGPIITAVPAILVGFTDGIPTGLAVAGLYLIIQQVENQVLVPRVTGNALKLHAAILLALLVIAAQIGGLLLVIFSAPLAAIGRDAFTYLHQRLREPPVPPVAALATVMGEESTDSGVGRTS